MSETIQQNFNIKNVSGREIKSHIVIRSLEALKAILEFAYKPECQYSEISVLDRLKNETSFSLDLKEVLYSKKMKIEILSHRNIVFRDLNTNELLFQFFDNTNTLVEYDYTIANGGGDTSYKIEPNQFNEGFNQKEAEDAFKVITNNIVAVENSHHEIDGVLANRFPELVTIIFK